MKILSLETSAKACSAAVTEDGALLGLAYQNVGLTHSRTLMPMVEDLLKNAGLTLAEMDAVAVARGPGSFTGIRIGVAAAKGLAFAAGLPVIGVSTLARRNQIYNALFQAEGGRLTRLCDDRAIALADLARELSAQAGPIWVTGDGAALCLAYMDAAGLPCRPAAPHLLFQSAAGVGLSAQLLAEDPAQLLAPQTLTPLYLRPPQAQRLSERRKP